MKGICLAKIPVMYWKEIPLQLQAQDEHGVVSTPLDQRFQDGVDAISMFDGSTEDDTYLMSWEWGEFSEVPGTAKEASFQLAKKYNESFPTDFVSRIRDLHRQGIRNPLPGSLDHWLTG